MCMMLSSRLLKTSAVVFVLSNSLFRWIFRISSLNTSHIVFHYESLMYLFQLNTKVLLSIRVKSLRCACIMNLIKGVTVLKVECRCCWWRKRGAAKFTSTQPRKSIPITYAVQGPLVRCKIGRECLVLNMTL